MDEEATQLRLHSLLLNKDQLGHGGDDPLRVPGGQPAADAASKASAGDGAPRSSGLPGAASGAAPKAHRQRQRTESSGEGPDPELEVERRKFVGEVCAETTRREVVDWVDKIFTMTHNANAAAAMALAKEKRRRKTRAKSSSATSDAGLSGLSGVTGVTGETGFTGTTATALHAAGENIAARRPARSVDSDESLVVHKDHGDQPLSSKERLQAFLESRIPELAEHVNEHVTAQTGLLQREVDEDIADEYLQQCNQRKVFDGRANYLRWQNERRQILQKRLEADMSKWIVEGVDSWDQKKAMEGKEKEVGEADLIFEYLTKRGAKIDTGKLPAEIPVFKALHASYSLPSFHVRQREKRSGFSVLS